MSRKLLLTNLSDLSTSQFRGGYFLILLQPSLLIVVLEMNNLSGCLHSIISFIIYSNISFIILEESSSHVWNDRLIKGNISILFRGALG